MKQRWMFPAVALVTLVAGSLTAEAGSITSSSVWEAVRSQAKPDIQPAWGYYGYGGYYRPYYYGGYYRRYNYGGYYRPYYYGGYYRPYNYGGYGGYYRPYRHYYRW
jgi:hypothetical protein